MKQSEKLTEFYRAYIDAVDKINEGKESPEWFDDEVGLCDNLQNYSLFTGWSKEIHIKIDGELYNQFVKAKLDEIYPFGLLTFHNSKNKYRIRWVRQHLSRVVNKKFKKKGG